MCFQVIHQKIGSAAEGGWGSVTYFANGRISVDLIIYTAVYNYYICRFIQVIDSATKAEVVTRFGAGFCLVGKSGATDAVVIGCSKFATISENVVITVIDSVSDTDTFGDTVTQKINDLSF